MNLDSKNMKRDNHFSKHIELEYYYILIKSPVYIAVSDNLCAKCKKTTPVLSIAAKSFLCYDYSGAYGDDNLYWIKHDDFTLFSSIKSISRNLWDILQHKFSFYKVSLSKTEKSKIWLNHCISCNTIQDDNTTHNTPGGPFWPKDEISLNTIKLIPIAAEKDTKIFAKFEYNSFSEKLFQLSKR